MNHVKDTLRFPFDGCSLGPEPQSKRCQTCGKILVRLPSNFVCLNKTCARAGILQARRDIANTDLRGSKAVPSKW